MGRQRHGAQRQLLERKEVLLGEGPENGPYVLPQEQEHGKESQSHYLDTLMSQTSQARFVTGIATQEAAL